METNFSQTCEHIWNAMSAKWNNTCEDWNDTTTVFFRGAYWEQIQQSSLGFMREVNEMESAIERAEKYLSSQG